MIDPDLGPIQISGSINNSENVQNNVFSCKRREPGAIKNAFNDTVFVKLSAIPTLKSGSSSSEYEYTRIRGRNHDMLFYCGEKDDTFPKKVNESVQQKQGYGSVSLQCGSGSHFLL
jgi:hypothetical protein